MRFQRCKVQVARVRDPGHAGLVGITTFWHLRRPCESQEPNTCFLAREVRPPFLPSSLVIHVGTGTLISEPMGLYNDFSQHPQSESARTREPKEHPIGFREVTGMSVLSPEAAPGSAVSHTMVQAGVASLTTRSEPCWNLLLTENSGKERGVPTGFAADFSMVIGDSCGDV